MIAKLISGVILSAIAVVSGLLYVQTTEPSFGSINNDTGGYIATTTNAAMGSGAKVLKSTSGLFGSVVITLSSNAPLKIYDATTTGAYVYGASSTIADFKTTTAGTYTFDVTATRGIVIDIASTVGVASTTLTWK